MTKNKLDKKAPETGILGEAAKAIGTAIGSIAVKTGLANVPAAKKNGRIPKTGKRRLPRKEKKLVKKAAAKTAKSSQA